MKRTVMAIVLLLTGLAFSLGQHQSVQYIRSIGMGLNLTVEQSQGLTKQQAYNYLVAEYPQLPARKIAVLSRYWPAIRKMLIGDALERAKLSNKSMIQAGMESMFSDIEFNWSDPKMQRAVSVLAIATIIGDPNDY